MNYSDELINRFTEEYLRLTLTKEEYYSILVALELKIDRLSENTNLFKNDIIKYQNLYEKLVKKDTSKFNKFYDKNLNRRLDNILKKAEKSFKDSEDWVEELNKILSDLNISKRQLALTLHINPNTITYWFNGRMNPRKKCKERIREWYIEEMKNKNSNNL